jgi:hypothetical protein
MANIIFLSVLFFSLFGMLSIFFRKIPLILAFEFPKESAILRFKKKIKELNPFKNFSPEIFLQKWIAKIRILSLKVDNLTFNWLKKLRERQRKKEKKDDYWEKIKREIK